MKLLMSEICSMRKGKTINEKDIYSFKGNEEETSIPVISSSTTNRGVMGYIDIRHKDKFKLIGKKGNLTWVTNGYAGKVFLRDKDFLPTEKCGILTIKDKYKDLINSEWLEIYLNSITSQYVVAKEGNGKLEIVQMKNIPVEIPELKIQENVVKEFNFMNSKINKLKEIKTNIINQIQKLFNTNTESKKYKVGKLFSLFQGHQLTDKFIYDNIGHIPVYSGSDNSIKGYINEVLIEEELPCIIYQTKGNRDFKSKIVYKPFNANNTAILKPKKGLESLYNIHYIQLILHKNMKEIVNSESGVSYIDTKILETEFSLPSKEVQNEIYKEYEKLENLLTQINSLIVKYSFN